ncbi:hypothetical protein [Anabaena sp. CCY 9910]|uniref:hypothetical protein n=1 Tax=Anabaena sp. CCY 9910 TaxID=3103870 RepID=UPI0039DFF960
MKKGNILLTTLLTASIFINGGMAKANTQSDRQEIIRRYQWMSDGCNARLIQQCYAYWSIGFQGRGSDGSLTNFTEHIQSTYKLFQQASQYQHRDEFIRINVNGNRAEVMGLSYSDYVIGNKRIHSQTPYEDIWEKTSNGWVLVSARWYKGNYNETAIGRSPTQANSQLSPEQQERLRRIIRQYGYPAAPSTSVNQQFNFVHQMPRFWNP